MRAVEATITVVDFEGTGAVEGHPDEPWQIGLVRMEHGRVVAESAYATFLRVGERPFSRHAPGRHAELRAELAIAPQLPSLWPALRSWLSGPVLAAHNIATEKRYLKSAFPLHPLGPWIDTLKLIRLAHPDLDSHKLEDVLAALQLSARIKSLLPGRAPHDALFDALCSALLLEHLLQQPEWTDATVAALVAARPQRFHRRIASRRWRSK